MTGRTVAVIPRSVLFGNAAYASPGISPDGRRLHYLAPDEEVMNVWVAPLEQPEAAWPVTHDRGRGIRSFGFCHDDRTLYYLRDRDGDESWRLYLVDLDTGQERCVTPFEGVQTRVLAHNRWHPNLMLVGLNRQRRELHDVYRLELDTGELTKIADNPGFLSWEIDTELRVRGGTMMKPEGGMSIHLAEPRTGQWRPWLDVPYEDVMGTRIVGYSRDGRSIYLLSSIGENASNLYAVDAETGQRSWLAGDPTYDITRVEMDPQRRRPQAVVFAKDREEWEFLDEDYAAAVKRLRGELARRGISGEVYPDRAERTGSRWTVTVVAPDQPVRYYTYELASGELRFLSTHQPELAAYQLASMEPFEFRARDGVVVHGYVTWPPGSGRRALPAVVNVHGGPWSRNSWCYDEEAQWLANRGYACVQVNFRGSVGYGKHFHRLGAKEWGRAMQTDLLDAVDHLVAEGAIDPSRIAIMGCSYGGYAALAGAAFTPDVFACAVDLCGPSNLLTLFAAAPAYWKPLLAFMYANIGHPDTERDMLWERSPLSRVEDITIPVLVVQGANDVRVTQAEAEQIVAALAAKGVPHEYLLFPDEGHGLLKPANRETYYAAVERFLDRHNYGKVVASPGVETTTLP